MATDTLVTAAADGLFSHLDPSRYEAAAYVSGNIAHQVRSDEFGIDYGRLADAIGVDGARLKLEGNDLWKVVQKQDTRRNRRG